MGEWKSGNLKKDADKGARCRPDPAEQQQTPHFTSDPLLVGFTTCELVGGRWVTRGRVARPAGC